MTSVKRVSAFERLRGLPPVFTSNDVLDTHGITVQAQYRYIKGWEDKGMIRRLTRGVSLNFVADPEAAIRRMGHACETILARPFCLSGEDSLIRYGFLDPADDRPTTVLTRNEQGRYFVPATLEGSGLCFRGVSPSLIANLLEETIPDVKDEGMPVLKPAAALAEIAVAASAEPDACDAGMSARIAASRLPRETLEEARSFLDRALLAPRRRHDVFEEMTADLG